MMNRSIDYLIKSALGNERMVTDEDLENFQLIFRDEETLHFLYNNVKYTGEILEHDAEMKQVKMRINDHIIELSLQDDLDQQIEKMGMSFVDESINGDIISPMPGLVLDILVKEGDVVQKGDSILVLEAMKMENLLQAPADGTVQKIRCKVNETVDKGALMVVID